MELKDKDFEEIREFLSRGNEYAGTQEIINDVVESILINLESDLTSADEIGLTNGSNEFATLQDFVEEFWDRSVNLFMNVLETQGSER